MPRDVRTRWNSTYQMLSFAVEYREAVDSLTSDRTMGLRQMELDEEEWKIAGQLCEILKVSHIITGVTGVTHCHRSHTALCAGVLRRYTVLLALDP